MVDGANPLDLAFAHHHHAFHVDHLFLDGNIGIVLRDARRQACTSRHMLRLDTNDGIATWIFNHNVTRDETAMMVLAPVASIHNVVARVVSSILTVRSSCELANPNDLPTREPEQTSCSSSRGILVQRPHHADIQLRRRCSGVRSIVSANALLFGPRYRTAVQSHCSLVVT